MFLFYYYFLFYFLAVTGRHFLGLRKPITRQTSRGKDPLQRGSGAQRAENALFWRTGGLKASEVSSSPTLGLSSLKTDRMVVWCATVE